MYGNQTVMPEKAAHAYRGEIHHELAYQRATEPIAIGVGEPDEKLIETDIYQVVEL